MAKTIDTLQVDASVTGAEQLSALQAKLNSIEQSSKQTATAMNQVQGGVRNVAYQIQDLAVQLAGGTNAFVALGQQLPQLLSGFGTAGVVIGAVAAVAIPLLQQGLKAAGVDMRNLSELTRDLGNDIEKYTEAQKLNLATAQGLASSYGSLAINVKDYYGVLQQVRQDKALIDEAKTIKELKSEYGGLYESVRKNTEAREAMSRITGQTYSTDLFATASAKELLFARYIGLSSDQALELGKRLKDLDVNAPEKNIQILSDTTKWLSESTKESGKFERAYEKVIVPITEANNKLIEQQKNIRAAAQDATDFASFMLRNENTFGPNIAAAKRNFDQVSAIRLEGEQKTAEYLRQIQEKNKQDGLDRENELAEGTIRIQQEVADKIKDFNKSQFESFNTQMLSNEAKLRELNVQTKINDLQLQQVDGINYTLMAEERTLKNVLDQQNAMSAIAEMRRKNAISASQAAMLEQQISETRKKADEIGEQAAKKIAVENERSIRIQIQGLQTTNAEKLKALGLDMNSLTMSTNRFNFEKKQLDLENTRTKALIDIDNNTRLSDGEKQDARKRLNDEYNVGVEILKSEYEWAQKVTDSFGAGAVDKIKGIQESFSNFKVAGMMVDSVWGNMSSSLDKFVETGKLSFGDLTRSIIIDLEKIALKSAVVGVFKSIGLMDMFALPGRAAGGPVNANSPYVIGEQGPELFIPSTAGRIVPNGKGNGGGSFGGTTIINNHINAVDAKSVAQLFAENRMVLFGNVEQARRELPMRTR